MKWFKRRSAPAPAPEPRGQGADAPAKTGISRTALAMLGASRDFELTPVVAAPRIENPFKPAEPAPGVDAPAMAMDDAATEQLGQLQHHEGIGFLGYPFLAELAQRPEYRHITETIAEEMTREWIAFVSAGDDDDGESFAQKAKALKEQFAKAESNDERLELIAEWVALLKRQDVKGTGRTEKLKKIDARFRELRVRDHFRRAAEIDGFMGRSHIYLDTGKGDDPEELKVPLVVDRRKIRKGSLKRLTVVEPMWAYPGNCNTTEPLKGDFYVPGLWYVMAKQVHRSRLLTFVGHEVPDVLKPAYSFGGLSMSQMAMPYVQNWLRTRQSVSDLLHSYTVWGLKTDLGAIMMGGDAEQLICRAELFNKTRDNRGLMMLQKPTAQGDPGEEFFNVSTPLGTLDKLLAQAQEQMAAVARIPLVKFLGISPAGLNASSDGEIRVFYDYIGARQERLFGAHLEKLLKIVQLDLFGEIDPDIGYEFAPLWQLDELAQANARKVEADIDCEYLDRSVLSAEEVRRKLAADRSSPYASLDVSDLPEASEDPEGGPGDDGGEEGGEGPGDPFDAAERAQAQDAEHWITVHPNGREHEGQPLLIEGGEGGSYTVKGGAGGKLNGETISPKSVSKPRGETPESARANKLSETARTPDEHKAAVSAHMEAARRAAEKGDHRAVIRHHDLAEAHQAKLDNPDQPEPAAEPEAPEDPAHAAARSASERADQLSAGAETEEQHSEAAQAHHAAAEQHEALGATEAAQRHRAKFNEHAEASARLQQEAAKKKLADLSERALRLSDTAKTAAEHAEANRLHNEAANLAQNMGEEKLAREHRLMAGKHQWEHRKADKREQRKAARQEHQASAEGQKTKQVEARFASQPAAEVAAHFKEKYGLGFLNGSNAARELKALRKERNQKWGSLTKEQIEAYNQRLGELSEAARGTPSTRVRSHVEYDIDDGSAGAKSARKTLGHVDAALEHLVSSGFDVKEALSKVRVSYTPGNTGKALGHAWQDRLSGVGYFTLSSGKVSTDEILSQQRGAEMRRAAGKGRFTVASEHEHPMIACAIHELAHAIGMQPHVNSPMKLAGIFDKMFNGNHTEKYKWIRANISEYAASNILESDAELAALVTAPNYQRGTLPKELEDHVDALFHRKA